MPDVSLKYLLYGDDVSASKSVENVGSVGQQTAGAIGKSFGALGNAVGGEVGEMANSVQMALDGIGERAAGLGAKLTAAGGIFAGVGVAMDEFAKSDVESKAQLKSSVEASGHSFEEYEGKFDGVIHKMENFNHKANDTQDALRILTTSTKDPAKAIGHMGLVANLAAAQHISLRDAAGLVVKIMAGSGTRTLTQYGIHLDTTKSKTKANHDALGELSTKLDGQASAAVHGWGGKIDVLKTKLEDWTSTISAKLGPALTAIGPLMMIVGTAMEIVKIRQHAAAAATDLETAATTEQTVVQKAAAIAAKAWAAATWLVNAALDANPIAIVVIAIVALVAIVILAWKHFQTFRDVVKAVLGEVRNIVGDVVGFIKDHWKLLLDILTGPFGLLVTFVSDHFDKIRGYVSDVIGFFKDHWKLILAVLTGPFGLAVLFISKHFDTIVGWVGNLPGRIKNAAVGMWDGITGAFRSAINAVISMWDRLVGHLKIGGFHHFGVNFGGVDLGAGLHINPLALGGIVTRPTLALVGEAGPEAVIPLSHPAAAGYAGGITNQITINAGPMTHEGARELDRVLRQLHRDTGGALGLAPA